MKQIRKTKSVTPVCARVVDTLFSTSTTDALSANMGKELNDKIDNLELTGGSGTGGEVMPIGTMIPYVSDKDIPSNWRICDGSEVSRSTYSKLFRIIGTSYGEGDGETTFNLPNKQGRVSVGLDTLQTDFNTIGKTGGKKEVALTVDEMPIHSHEFTRSRLYFAETAGPNALGATNNASNSAQTRTLNEGGNQPHTNLQPYEVDVWIIKVDNIVSSLEETTGTIIDNLTSTSTTDALSANMGRELNQKMDNLFNSKRYYEKVLESEFSFGASASAMCAGNLHLDLPRGRYLIQCATNIETTGNGTPHLRFGLSFDGGQTLIDGCRVYRIGSQMCKEKFEFILNIEEDKTVYFIHSYGYTGTNTNGVLKMSGNYFEDTPYIKAYEF